MGFRISLHEKITKSYIKCYGYSGFSVSTLTERSPLSRIESDSRSCCKDRSSVSFDSTRLRYIGIPCKRS
jgi:hypothetical protein